MSQPGSESSVSAGRALDPLALTGYLQKALPGCTGDLDIQRIGGGHSNPTYFITYSGGGDYVLRKQPPGKLLPSAHAIDREFRVILRPERDPRSGTRGPALLHRRINHRHALLRDDQGAGPRIPRKPFCPPSRPRNAGRCTTP